VRTLFFLLLKAIGPAARPIETGEKIDPAFVAVAGIGEYGQMMAACAV
jgi:hypothetical protein